MTYDVVVIGAGFAGLSAAVRLTKRGAKVLGIVGRDGGATARAADVCILIPTVSPERITPHAESFQGVIWHLLVNALIQ